MVVEDPLTLRLASRFLKGEAERMVLVDPASNSLVFVVVALSYVVLSIIVGALAASAKGRSGGGWFVISLLVSPLFAILFLIVVGDHPDRVMQALELRRSAMVQSVEKATANQVPTHPWRCPTCSYQNKSADRTCYNCGRDRPT